MCADYNGYNITCLYNTTNLKIVHTLLKNAFLKNSADNKKYRV